MSPKQNKTRTKLIPAVFFQKELDGVKEGVQIPERLALFESQLREVVGGALAKGTLAGTLSGGKLGYTSGSTTFSYSAGWADVLQADDCAA